MKICFLVDSIYSLGGYQRCTVNIANMLKSEGYDITIVCTRDIKLEKRINYGLNDEIKIKNIRWGNNFFKIIMIWTKILILLNNKTNLLKNNFKILSFIYYKKNILGLKKIQTYFNKNKFDCIIGVSAYYSMVLGLIDNRNNAKLIGWQHSTSKRYFDMPGEFLWHQDALVSHVMKKLDEYIVLTKADTKLIRKKFHKVASVIYNPNMLVSTKKSDLTNKTILAVGRYHNVKGFDLLLEAFSIFHQENPDWKLRIVGDGIERENLKKQIKQLNLDKSVNLVYPTNSVLNEYLNASIFVLSSRIEGWGLVVVEAMECGLPIVSFDLDCVHEIFSKNEGIVVEYLNTEQMAKAFFKLANDYKLRKKMGELAIEQAKKFKIEKIKNDWIKVINGGKI
ncbi:MAG: glycosyltransferase family 4 protein [Bacilli bacterium]|nr:glycosyltransferase family 4 protein [Bacilli bacterium]